MADVEITYNNNTIVSMSSSGTEILETDGTFLTDDITIEYTKPTPTLQSKSATPTESAQTITPDSGYDGLSQVSVGAISSSYVGSNVPRQSAQTITPTTTNQTIANGTYLTGTQTILGDQNLVAGNIKKDVVLFGVTGTLESGGGESSKLVNFIDYDGTLLHSYSASEWANVSALPSNPSHTGLIAQGWNWTKSQIDAQLTAYPNKEVFVGQMYTTSSGKTEIDVTFDDSNFLSPYLFISPNGTVEIDWGDNSSTDTLAGTSLTRDKSIQHIYSSTGTYTIKLKALSGEFSFNMTSSGNSGVLSTAAGFNTSRLYSDCITSIRIGQGAKIGNYAFEYCYSLVSVTIPSTVTSIGNTAFGNCHMLKSLTIPSGITSIGTYAFFSCFSLESLSIAGGITSISNYMVPTCYNLQSLTIPSTVTSIGGYAFENCYTLKSLTVPNGVTSISNYTFSGCYSLKEVTIPSGVTSIDAFAFRYCYNLQSLTIPSGVTSIGNSAFSNCQKLTSLTIPNGVTSIGDSLFASCYALKSLTIPSNATSIGKYTFSACYTLTSLTIPSTVTSIGNYAFQNCSGVTAYHFLSATPPTLGTNVFSGIKSGTIIYVPSSSVNDYKTATNWSSYASYIQGE